MTRATHSHESCRRMFERLSEYLDGELDEAACSEIQKHVRECVPCDACLETLKRTVALCRESEVLPVPETLPLRLKAVVRRMARGDPSD
jgi:anti-sigma factor RsiW